MTKLKDLLAEPEYTAVKLAVETPDNQQVERDFGRLAFAFLKDRAAPLVQYLVGFEVVEQEPDGSRAVGIFGFRIASSFYYVPVFFLNNQIKGMDLLYSKEEGHFVPLREPWVNHILNRKTIELGEPADMTAKKDFAVPDYTFLSRPPLGGSTKLAEVGKLIYDAWNQMQKEATHLLNTDVEFGKAFAGAVMAMKKQAAPRAAGHTTLINYLENHGGPNAVASLLNTIGSNMPFMKAANSFYDYHDLMVSEFSGAIAPKTAQAKVRVVTEAEVDDYPVSTSDRKKIIRDGFTITDNRTDEEKSEVYDVDYLTHVANPNVTGKYDLMLASGVTTPVFVVNIPYGTSKKGMTLVVHPDTGRHFTAHNKIIYVRDGVKEKADNDQLYTSDRATNVEDMNVGDSYILVDEKGCASLPFRVRSATSEDNETVRINVKWNDDITYDDRDTTPGYFRDTAPENRPLYSLDCWGDSNLILLDRRGELKKSGNNVVVPVQQWRAYKLEVPDLDVSYEEREVIREAFRPASYTNIIEAMDKIAFHDVKVESRDDGLAYSVTMDGLLDRDALNYKAASVHLVGKYGFPVGKAEEILKEAARNIKAKRLVLLKSAQQVIMPEPPPQYMGYDQQLGVPVQPVQADYVSGQTVGMPPPMQVGPGSGVNLGGEGASQQMMGGEAAMLPDDAGALAQEAAMTGQQQVFDHAVIGGLSRIYDTSAAIDSFVPDMMKALDRVGRILFLFYWKNEDFAERYGDQDLTEMEDHIRAVFKSLGDLVLKLKQKTIDAEEAEYVQGG
jgi:hypothetical protein